MLAKELELAEARKTEDADGLLVFEKPLPLANLDTQIVCADALFTAWPQADAIIGNPPYLGSRYLAKEHGYDYARKLHARFPAAPKMADLCTHWFRLAHDALPPGGRAGLVGTNTIRQNESREASLGYLVENGGVITEAVSTQVWSGDAAVHVSIVNWKKAAAASEDARPELPGSTRVPRVGEGVPPSRTSADVPAGEDAPATPDIAGSSFRRDAETNTRDACAPRIQTRRLTFQRGDSVESPWETFELPHINSSLSAGPDVTGAQILAANAKEKKCFQGQNPVNAGFFLAPDEAADMIHADALDHCIRAPEP